MLLRLFPICSFSSRWSMELVDPRKTLSVNGLMQVVRAFVGA
jgi:hypothetical protein